MTDLLCNLHYINAFMWYKGDLVHSFPDNGDTFDWIYKVNEYIRAKS